MELKDQYKHYQHQKLVNGQKRFNNYAQYVRHPVNSTKNNYNYAHHLGEQYWKQSTEPPTMTHMEAMKQAGSAFNNLRLSSKLTIFGLGILLIGGLLANFF